MFVGYMLRRMTYANEEDIPCILLVLLFKLNDDALPPTMHFVCDNCQSRPMNSNDLLLEQRYNRDLDMPVRSKHTISLTKEGQLVWY